MPARSVFSLAVEAEATACDKLEALERLESVEREAEALVEAARDALARAESDLDAVRELLARTRRDFHASMEAARKSLKR